jgi:calcium/proton exchanger cax
VEATEELAFALRSKIGGLLNATLGNAAELIITIVALRAGKYELVKASLTGSIIGNCCLLWERHCCLAASVMHQRSIEGWPVCRRR